MPTGANDETGDAMSILIDDIHKTYGAQIALAGVTLSIREGERFGLIGPDGAGKSSLMRILCGLLRADHGSFTLCGLDGSRDLRAIKSSIGYMPQRFSLYPDLTVAENLRFFADLFTVPRKEREERLERLYRFSRLKPFAARRAAALSGGMKQKLALSCALIHTPRVLILDEPTTGVDPVSRREFWDILSELSRDGTTILVSTPYMDEAARCDRIAFIHHGRLLAVDTPAGIPGRFPLTILEFRGRRFPVRHDDVLRVRGVASVRLLGDRLRVACESREAVERSVRDTLERGGAEVLSVRTDTPSIEDTFVHLMHEEPGHV